MRCGRCCVLYVTCNLLGTYFAKTGSAKGTLLAKDYIMHNEHVVSLPDTCRTLYTTPEYAESFRTHAEGSDHIPVVTKVRCKIKGHMFTRRRVQKYDSKALKVPSNVDLFEKAIKLIPQVPFAVEPSTHSKVIDDYVHYVMCQLFPRPPALPRHPVMSEKTFSYVMAKANLIRMKKVAGRYLAKV